VLVFKPAFGIATVWSYGQMAAEAPGSYIPQSKADAHLAAWLVEDGAPADALLFNNMETPAFAKYLALPVLCRQLETQFGLKPHLSGSGSACFVLLADNAEVAPIVAAIREAWGESTFVREARLA
jgi:4-diphosphocytidyl-2-C-methyl-D-erythritol kinase